MFSRSVCPTLQPQGSEPASPSVHGDSPDKNTGVGCHALPPGVLPNPGIEPRSPILQGYSLPSEPPGKPMNTGVGSLSLLQGDLPDPGTEVVSPVLQAEIFTS